MSALTAALFSTMNGDATLTADLGTYASAPCIFTVEPVPPAAARPYVVAATPVADVGGPFDTKTSGGRDHIRQVEVVTDALDTVRRERIAERIRTLFHRQAIAVAGFTNPISEVEGPFSGENDRTVASLILSVRLVLSQN